MAILTLIEITSPIRRIKDHQEKCVKKNKKNFFQLEYYYSGERRVIPRKGKNCNLKNEYIRIFKVRLKVIFNICI